MPCRPFGVDGLLSDETMAPTFHVLMDPVHPALFDLAPLIVMVWDHAVVSSAARSRKVTEVQDFENYFKQTQSCSTDN